MRPKGTKQKLEIRRRAAVALRKQGFSVREVANVIGCAPSAVVQWERDFDEGGAAGLDSKPSKSGSKSRMTDKQRERLREILIEGARSQGWQNDLWTLARVAAVIGQQFGVRYHISHVHRLLHQMGFSCQKPEYRAREQSPEDIENFRKKRWPAIKKKRARIIASSF